MKGLAFRLKTFVGFIMADWFKNKALIRNLAVSLLAFGGCYLFRILVVDPLVGAEDAFFPYYPLIITIAFFLGYRFGGLLTVLSLLIVNANPSWMPQNRLFINLVFFLLCLASLWLIEQLRSLLSREKYLRQSQSDLIGMLAHEIKTSLSGIQAAASSLSLMTSSELAEGRIRNQKRAIEEIRSILDRCIEANRIDAGCMLPEMADLSVSLALDEAIRQQQETHRIKLHCPSVMRINTDPFILGRILNNLIHNALQYSPPDSTITLQGFADRRHGKSGITIRCSNRLSSGSSFDPSKVFDKYYRGPEGMSLSGAGLGLWLVRSFVEILSGDIRCRVEGREVLFMLWLPLSP